MQTILISEIFGPTIQGEGALIGRPTVFVRTGGCDFRCSWCDTLYAVLPDYKGEWTPRSPESILEEVENLSGGYPILITLSGGNPALQPLSELLRLGHERGHTFALETQGTAAPPWLAELDYLVLSPKPPSSGMEFREEKLAACAAAAGNAPKISLKIVVFDEADYQFARHVSGLYPEIPIYLQVGNPSPGASAETSPAEFISRLEWLLTRVAKDGWFQASVLPQLHVLLWGNKRGV